jgi:hypothetical protein
MVIIGYGLSVSTAITKPHFLEGKYLAELELQVSRSACDSCFLGLPWHGCEADTERLDGDALYYISICDNALEVSPV